MPKILVIEDNVLLLDVIKELLVLSGFCSITANSYQEGYELLEIDPPDLILCNYPFLDFNSLIILQKICYIATAKNIPLLLMLGYEPIQTPELQTILEQQEILIKPFPAATLLAKVQILLNAKNDEQ